MKVKISVISIENHTTIATSEYYNLITFDSVGRYADHVIESWKSKGIRFTTSDGNYFYLPLEAMHKVYIYFEEIKPNS